MKENEIRTGSVFYKISVGGEYNYSILFSNILDSTFADGSISRKNLICDEWTIHSAKVGRCNMFNASKELSELIMDDDSELSDIVVTDFKSLSFNGKKTKDVMPGEFFAADPVFLKYEKGELPTLEILSRRE